MEPEGQLEDGNANIDLDLDLDFSADDEPSSAISDVTGGTVTPAATEQTVAMQAQAPADDNGLDFDISGPGELTPNASLPDISMSMDALDLDGPLELPDFQSTGTMPPEPVVETRSAKLDDGMLEFDLGSLSLDLEPPESAAEPSTSGEDPLETKLALAEEFLSIGDSDGARALIEEVVAEASGDLRTKAERALANLS
jgi:pilus assembly protein FimV